MYYQLSFENLINMEYTTLRGVATVELDMLRLYVVEEMTYNIKNSSIVWKNLRALHIAIIRLLSDRDNQVAYDLQKFWEG